MNSFVNHLKKYFNFLDMSCLVIPQLPSEMADLSSIESKNVKISSNKEVPFELNTNSYRKIWGEVVYLSALTKKEFVRYLNLITIP